MSAPLSTRADATPVPLEHLTQSVQCLICHGRGLAHYNAFGYRPSDEDPRRNSMAIVLWICDGCCEALDSAFAALKVKGPVTR